MQQQVRQLRFATTRLATGPRVRYAEQGDPGGAPIIFLPAYSDSWFSYSRVLSLLSVRYHAYAHVPLPEMFFHARGLADLGPAARPRNALARNSSPSSTSRSMCSHQPEAHAGTCSAAWRPRSPGSWWCIFVAIDEHQASLAENLGRRRHLSQQHGVRSYGGVAVTGRHSARRSHGPVEGPTGG
jgi:hypothetical protein